MDTHVEVMYICRVNIFIHTYIRLIYIYTHKYICICMYIYLYKIYALTLYTLCVCVCVLYTIYMYRYINIASKLNPPLDLAIKHMGEKNIFFSSRERLALVTPFKTYFFSITSNGNCL
jgi:hypothetical protein